jgi:hypothetical protein
MTHFLVVLVGALVLSLPPQQSQSPALRIVVIEGEDAVNVIQQKTAVAPLIEIRDRNNLPVAGVAVTFSVGGQGASFGGLSTLTVTTNAAGQAAAVGLTPTAVGAVQINATALVQGQALTATITQTNVLTAAQAAGAAGGASGATGASGASGGSGASGASGAAAGGGGGISGTTIGIVGAAVAGGAVAATQVAGKEEEDPRREFAGPLSGQLSLPFQGCTRLQEMNGTLTIEIDNLNGPFQGTVHVQGNSRVLSNTGPQCGGPGPQVGSTDNFGISPKPISGSTPAISFTVTETNTTPAAPGTPGGGTNTVTFAFTGTLSGDTITGTLTQTQRIETPGSGFPAAVGTVTYSVTLRPN